MTQCPYPPPLTDFDSFRRRPPRPMFAPTLEVLVMMTGRKKTGKEKLENNIETTDTDQRHRFRPYPSFQRQS